MFRTRPVSRMRAGREALARAVLQIRSDFFMAVYGYGKMHAQLVAQGWDPAGVGRDRADEHHARAWYPGRAPRQNPGDDETRQGHGRQAGSGGREVRGLCAEPPARGRHHLRAHGQRLVRLHGVRRRRVRPSDRGMGVRHDHEYAGAAVAGVGQAISGRRPAAARMVLSATATMARSAPARCTPPGLWNMGCCRRPAPSATCVTTPWPKAPTARTEPSWYGGADPSRI